MRLRRRLHFFELVMVTILCAPVTMAVTFGVHLNQVDLASVFWAVVLSGVAACALIESGKRLLPFRAAYNRRETATWLRDRAIRGLYHPEDGNEERSRKALLSLDHALQVPYAPRVRAQGILSVRGWIHTIGQQTVSAYNLPAEQFVAQVAIATDRLLLRGQPNAWLDLLLLKWGERHPKRVSLARREHRSERVSLARREHRSERVSLAQTVSSARRKRRSERDSPSPEEWGPWAADEVAFALDQLQNQLATRWRFRVQLSSVALSGGVATVSLLLTKDTNAGAYVLAALLFGGFVSWVVRDATASLERFRR